MLFEGAESHRLRSEFALDAVNGICRFILAFQGFAAVIAMRNLTA